MADTPRTDAPDDDESAGKDDLVEYFGADGEDEGQKFHESGSVRPDLDDQTIAP